MKSLDSQTRWESRSLKQISAATTRGPTKLETLIANLDSASLSDHLAALKRSAAPTTEDRSLASLMAVEPDLIGKNAADPVGRMLVGCMPYGAAYSAQCDFDIYGVGVERIHHRV